MGNIFCTTNGNVFQNRYILARKSIYKDKESIHNSYIQKSFRESLGRLMKHKITVTYSEIIKDLKKNNFKSLNLVVQYCMDYNYCSLGLTFKDILYLVYNKIINHKYKIEILKILDDEMKISEHLCFTSKITGLVYCLQTFDDDVNIVIDDTEQIGNVVSIMRKKYINNDDFIKYTRIQLTELGYNNSVIESWLNYI